MIIKQLLLGWVQVGGSRCGTSRFHPPLGLDWQAHGLKKVWAESHSMYTARDGVLTPLADCPGYRVAEPWQLRMTMRYAHCTCHWHPGVCALFVQGSLHLRVPTRQLVWTVGDPGHDAVSQHNLYLTCIHPQYACAAEGLDLDIDGYCCGICCPVPSLCTEARSAWCVFHMQGTFPAASWCAYQGHGFCPTCSLPFALFLQHMQVILFRHTSSTLSVLHMCALLQVSRSRYCTASVVVTYMQIILAVSPCTLLPQAFLQIIPRRRVASPADLCRRAPRQC